MNGGLTLILPILLVLVAGGLLIGPMLHVSARADRWDADQDVERRAQPAAAGDSTHPGSVVRGRPFAERPYDWSRDLEVTRWT